MPAQPAGYARLIELHGLVLPLPPRLAALASCHRPRETDGWLLLPERYAPWDDLAGQLTFALKWEGVDLAVLDALFGTVPPAAVADAIRTAPTGAYMRRSWFLYEWLRPERLSLPDLGKARAVDAVDPEQQVALNTGPISARHRVRDNLPGTPTFCPMVRRTDAITRFQGSGLAERARLVAGRADPSVLARAAAMLRLSDSLASSEIDAETPPPDRGRRWAEAIGRSGSARLSLAGFEELQRLVIGDTRFVRLGLREDATFRGDQDRHTQEPLPVHIGARPDDLPSLVTGIIRYDDRARLGGIDPVAAAAVEAFGFLYIHPFEDGNGRIHRWLIHHVLAASGLAPPGISFPVSAVLLRELDRYRRTTESYSRPLTACIDWRATASGKVQVLGDTASWYRFFDATAHAEFLYECVETTIDQELLNEIVFLEGYDRFVTGMGAIVDMPARTLGMLHRLLRQNGGRLPQRMRERELSPLSDPEVARIETLYADTCSGAAAEPEGDDAE